MTAVKNYTAIAQSLKTIIDLLTSEKSTEHTKGMRDLKALKKKALKLAGLQENEDGSVVALKKDTTPKKLNRYMQFANERRAEIKAKHPSMSVTEISKELGRLWAKEKDKYVAPDGTTAAPAKKPAAKKATPKAKAAPAKKATPKAKAPAAKKPAAKKAAKKGGAGDGEEEQA